MQINDGISERELNSWKEFFKLVSDEFINAQAYVYRGESEYGRPIQSGIDRYEKKFEKRKNTSLNVSIPEEFSCTPLSREENLKAFIEISKGKIH